MPNNIAFLASKLILAGALSLSYVATTTSAWSQGSTIEDKVPTSVRESGKLILGTTATTGLPWSSVKPGTNDEFYGFDHDLGQAIAGKLGLTMEVNNLGFESLIPSLEAKRVDFVVSGMFDTDKRQQKVDFVDYAYGGSVMLQKASTDGPKEREDMCGFTVGARRGSLEAENASTISSACTKAGKQAVDLKIFPDYSGQLTALSSGQIDVVVGDLVSLALTASTHPDKFQAVGKPFNLNETGIAVLKGSDLGPVIQEALQELIKDGTYNRIFVQYQMPEASRITKATFNRGAQ